MEKNKRDFDKSKKAKDKKIEVGDQVMVASPNTTTTTLVGGDRKSVGFLRL